MFKNLFGDIKAGQLRRLAFLGYWILLIVSLISLSMIINIAIGAGETLLDGDLTAAQNSLSRWLSLPAGIIVAVIYLVLIFGHLNIVAKRLRDIGLAGWWSMLFIVILNIFITVTISEQGAQFFGLLIWIGLILIPGKTVSSSSNTLD